MKMEGSELWPNLDVPWAESLQLVAAGGYMVGDLDAEWAELQGSQAPTRAKAECVFGLSGGGEVLQWSALARRAVVHPPGWAVGIGQRPDLRW